MSDPNKVTVRVRKGQCLYEDGVTYTEGKSFITTLQRLPAIQDLVIVVKKGA